MQGHVLKRAGRTVHTVRHLRLAQVFGRAWYRAWRPRPDTGPAPPQRAPQRALRPAPLRQPSMWGPEEFTFLNETHRLASAADWDNPAWSRLWRYNLHYFDDLGAAGAVARGDWHRALLTRWVSENPPPRGVGWEPYPLARRIANWVDYGISAGPLAGSVTGSLAAQARWLARRIEWHLGGNHLIADARALVCAGAFFDGPEAAAWLEHGRRLLSAELAEQVGADGGHYERSPMYHAVVLEDLLGACNVLDAYGIAVPGSWYAAARALGAWLTALTHPDGEIAFFNDSAFGIAAPPPELLRYARDLGAADAYSAPGSVLLGTSGFARLQVAPALVLADCGSVGPDHLPGHAHAGTLSFELSLGAERVLVNSGTSLYAAGPERSRQRGTAAHNTVEVAGSDSSEVWHAFRVARRARVSEVDFSARPHAASLRATHDGYLRLGGGNLHRRTWQLTDRELRLEDEITGTPVPAVAHFHLHPALRLVAVDRAGSAEAVTAGGRHVHMAFTGARDLESSAASWHPEFGRTLAGTALRVPFAGAHLVTQIRWS